MQNVLGHYSGLFAKKNARSLVPTISWSVETNFPPVNCSMYNYFIHSTYTEKRNKGQVKEKLFKC